MMRYKTILNNRFIVWVDSIMRKIGYCIVLFVDLETGQLLRFTIKSAKEMNNV